MNRRRINWPLFVSGFLRGSTSRPVLWRRTAALAALLAAGPGIVDQVGLAGVTVAPARPDGRVGVTGAGAITIPTGAACDPSWLPRFGGVPGVSGIVNAETVFDDGLGGGPALYAGGPFTTAGGVTANRIAKWNGTHWSALGTGTSEDVLALTVYDDGLGGGPALYAGGGFTTAGGVTVNHIAKWDGTSWSALGTGTSGNVYALTVFDDGLGGGPALYAAGSFIMAGVGAGGAQGPGTHPVAPVSAPTVVNRIAKWNGTKWSPVGSGMSSGNVWALTVFDDGLGGGPALYAGGDFTTAGGVTVNRIAKWNGATWSALGTGQAVGMPGGIVYSLTVFDDGGGPDLYVGGFFGTAGGVPANSIAKWNGTNWSALGNGVNNTVTALTVYDDGGGGGPALFAGGVFTTAGGVPANRIAKWNGTSWSALGTGTNAAVYALTGFDDGSGGGAALYAGGLFQTAGGVTVNWIAKWKSTSWSVLGGMNNFVNALTVFDDGLGGGPALYAGGQFTTAGDVTLNRIAKWNGTNWSALGTGMDSIVRALTVFDDGLGGGPALYAGGDFTSAGGVTANRIAKWNGTGWSALAGGVNNNVVYAVTVFDDGSGGGPAFYAGGDFTTAGGVAANRIAKWNGTSWSALGPGMNAIVHALTVFDDGLGGGPALYAGGQFSTAGGVPANGIAKWNGASWSALVTGMNNTVFGLAVFDDGGSGPALYAGGDFTTAGGVAANRIAKWNGATWSALGTGMNSTVTALRVFDEGSGGGPMLYAGGPFVTAGGVPAFRIAKWNATSWSALGGGMNNIVRALTVFDDGLGGGPALYAGGDFTSAIDSGDAYLAKWGCAASGPVCPWDCGDQNGDVGVVDFLALLSQWGQVGTSCDFDGGGTGVTDFLDVLAHWGPCP